MKKLLGIAIVATLLFSSCKKEDEVKPTPVVNHHTVYFTTNANQEQIMLLNGEYYGTDTLANAYTNNTVFVSAADSSGTVRNLKMFVDSITVVDVYFTNDTFVYYTINN